MSLEEFAKRNVREKELEDEIETKGMAPVGSLMFTEVERRLDVFVFRCCFAHSVYEARRLVIHGYVTLNGKKVCRFFFYFPTSQPFLRPPQHMRPNTRLAPGDMVHVDPKAIRYFKPPHGEYDDVLGRHPEVKVVKKKEEKAPVEADLEAAVEQAEGESPAETISNTEPKDEGYMNKSGTSLTPFNLPAYASPWLFIPAYIEVSFLTCTAIYVRHPTARPGYSEIPTPYDADGALIRYAWEWYMQRRPRMRSKKQLSRMPEDRVLTVLSSLHKDTRYLPRGRGIDEMTPVKQDLATSKNSALM